MQYTALIVFIDFKKGFDSVETCSVITCMEKSRIDQRYIDLIKRIYVNSTMKIILNETRDIKLFNPALQDTFKILK